MRTKFTVPQMKAGTVFEYQYIKSSDFFYQIDDWYAQEGTNARIPLGYVHEDVAGHQVCFYNRQWLYG